MFTGVLIYGTITFTVLTTLASIPQYLAIKHGKLSSNSELYPSDVAAAVMILSILFLADGFRRMNKVLLEGECICKKAIVALFLIYLGEALQCLSFNFVKGPYASTFVLDVLYFLANTTLATILYRISAEQSAAANSKETFDLLEEDDIALNNSELVYTTHKSSLFSS